MSMPLVVLLPAKVEVRQVLENYNLANKMFWRAVNTLQINSGGNLPPRHFVFPRTLEALEELECSEYEFRTTTDWLCERWWNKTHVFCEGLKTNGKHAPMTVYELLPNPFVFIFYPDVIKEIRQTNSSIQQGLDAIFDAVFTSNLIYKNSSRECVYVDTPNKIH